MTERSVRLGHVSAAAIDKEGPFSARRLTPALQHRHEVEGGRTCGAPPRPTPGQRPWSPPGRSRRWKGFNSRRRHRHRQPQLPVRRLDGKVPVERELLSLQPLLKPQQRRRVRGQVQPRERGVQHEAGRRHLRPRSRHHPGRGSRPGSTPGRSTARSAGSATTRTPPPASPAKAMTTTSATTTRLTAHRWRVAAKVELRVGRSPAGPKSVGVDTRLRPAMAIRGSRQPERRQLRARRCIPGRRPVPR